MDAIDPNEYTLVQLKEWLSKLGMSTSGTKSALATRLNSIPIKERGECPLEETAGEEVDEEVLSDKAFELIRKELELVKKERDLLARENNLLKKTVALDNTQASVTSGSCVEQPVQLADGVTFSVLRDCLPDYDGGSNFDLWAVQLKNIAEVYGVGASMLRTLLISKLKGKALVWLQSKPDYATETAENLLGQMKELFGSKEAKMMLRRNFEARKWRYGETFTEYFNEKIILANQIKLDEEELIDYLIEGIPDPHLRTQATMQNFTNKLQLQQALAKLTLPGRQQATVSRNNIRCHNCNSFGHYAADCAKPKRDPGTC